MQQIQGIISLLIIIAGVSITFGIVAYIAYQIGYNVGIKKDRREIKWK